MKIHVHRYDNPPPNGFEGYVEPEHESGATAGWILYFRSDGSALLYSGRERSNSAHPGAVVGHGVELPAYATETHDGA